MSSVEPLRRTRRRDKSAGRSVPPVPGKELSIGNPDDQRARRYQRLRYCGAIWKQFGVSDRHQHLARPYDYQFGNTDSQWRQSVEPGHLTTNGRMLNAAFRATSVKRNYAGNPGGTLPLVLPILSVMDSRVVADTNLF